MASRALLTSFGASSISTPRGPPFRKMVLSLKTAASRATGTLLLPEGTDPVDVVAGQAFSVGATHHSRSFAAECGSQLFYADLTIGGDNDTDRLAVELGDKRLRPVAAVGCPVRIAADFKPVHRVRPELVAEVKYLTWTEDELLRQIVYEGLREDKPPTDIRRPIPHPQPAR